MEFKDRWIILVFLALLILTLVVPQTKREILRDGNLRSLPDAHGEGHPNHKRAYSSAAKTAAFSYRDKCFTLFDLLETILDPGFSNENSQDLVEVMEKDRWKPGETTK